MSDDIRKRTLSTRLFASLFTLALLSFLAATVIVVSVSWSVYEGDAEIRLSSQAEATAEEVSGMSAQETITHLSSVRLSGIRITLVSADGTVLYDSDIDESTMANHGGREEIVSARGGDETVVLRVSETTGTDTLYTAILLSDGQTVLRLSETRTSLTSFLRHLLAPLALATLLAVALSAIFARTITRRATSPLLNVDLEFPMRSDTYREIEPLLARIDAQRKELVSKNEQLENAMEMRREFTGNVSHEMKSPLQVISGYAELIESGIATEEDTRKFAALIRSESEAMRMLIDDVLMLSRLDESIDDDPHPLDISLLCLRIVQRLEPKASANNTSIEVRCEDSMLVMGYEILAEQAIYNLVDNAVRYGGEQVTIAIERLGALVEVTVSDDGPGVPADQRERIFERFYRLETSRSRSTGGTGLGLAIVKHAMEVMGGSILVTDSELGGAAFVATFVAATPDA